MTAPAPLPDAELAAIEARLADAGRHHRPPYRVTTDDYGDGERLCVIARDPDGDWIIAVSTLRTSDVAEDLAHYVARSFEDMRDLLAEVKRLRAVADAGYAVVPKREPPA